MESQHPNCVILTQVGHFYELYFEQAQEFGPKLGIKVTSKKTSNHEIPMSGFPVAQLQKFVKILVQDLGESVAIVDQYKNQEVINNLIHRRVSRIVTPGTLIEETFINYNENNYLASIYLPPNCTKVKADPNTKIGIAWIDVSVGDFYVQESTLGELDSDISRITPSEIILPQEFQKENLLDGEWFTPFQQLKRYFLRYHNSIGKDLKSEFESGYQTTRKALESFSGSEIAAMNMILSYIHVNLPDSKPHLDIPIQYGNEKYLQMDPRTRAALELIERSTGGRLSVVGTLLSTIKRTVTTSGTRLLTQYLKSPILDTEELLRRQKYVALFKDHGEMRVTLRTKLSQLGDLVRSLQRLSFGTGDQFGHLLSIGDGLSKLKDLEDYLTEEFKSNPKTFSTLENFLDKFRVPNHIVKEINSTLHVLNKQEYEVNTTEENEVNVESNYVDNGSYGNNSVNKYLILPQDENKFEFLVKRDFSIQLSSLHDHLDQLYRQEESIITSLTNELSAIDPTVNVKRMLQSGRHFNSLHISGKRDKLDEIHRQYKMYVRDKRKDSLIYKPLEWSQLQNEVEGIKQDIRNLEKEIIENLRLKVLEDISSIRQSSELAGFLDVMISFSVLAEEFNLTCPIFLKGNTLNITGGRHLVVESSLRETGINFTPNDTKLSSPNSMTSIISGPNMGGKSTFLRQNALIIILAQIGCFVPADKAKIGLVDKIFTRIGASDDIFNDLSTFMVEMVETSNILQNATPKSLAIVDEIGRGTSGKEGLALAYATLMHLVFKNKCRTLFATHFGLELKQLMEENDINQTNMKFLRTRVLIEDEIDKKIIIDHNLEPGISERSYALEVAAMAGFPKSALENAKSAYRSLALN
ncbi:muts domain V-domain-containing protein [Scheffersomyces amazonensis]|uniref:muts domain V-domain-containing protein n=1 Tax=Scheffersomyces amazonensis TaxID=1078765 RepID=UPI00315CC3AB